MLYSEKIIISILLLIIVIFLNANSYINYSSELLNYVSDLKIYSSRYPSFLEYKLMGYYSIDQSSGDVLITIHPEIISYNNYGRLYIINMIYGITYSISFLDFEPIHAYFFNKYVIVTGIFYRGSIDVPIGSGYGIYVLNRDYKILSKLIIERGMITRYLPSVSILPINSKHFILPIPSVTINGSSYVILYDVWINNGEIKEFDKLIDLRISYYPHTTPIKYNDLILWGGLIISYSNNTLLKNYSGSANATNAAFIVNNTYYFTREYINSTGRIIELVGINLSTLRITHRRILFNLSSATTYSIIYSKLINNRFLALVIATSTSKIGLLFTDKIVVAIYDVYNAEKWVIYESSVNGFLVGEYKYFIVLLTDSKKLWIINPQLNITYNITLSGLKFSYSAPGDLILLYDSTSKCYYMLLLPILYNKYYLLIFERGELKPLNEPLTTILLLSFLLVIIIKNVQHRKR